MTEKEVQAQIDFLVSELERLRNSYNILSDDASEDMIVGIDYGHGLDATEKAYLYFDDE